MKKELQQIAEFSDSPELKGALEEYAQLIPDLGEFLKERVKGIDFIDDLSVTMEPAIPEGARPLRICQTHCLLIAGRTRCITLCYYPKIRRRP